MTTGPRSPRSDPVARLLVHRRWLVLLAATLAGVLGVVGSEIWASLARSDRWVTRTYEAKLAIARCRLALARGDVAALGEAEEQAIRVTADDPIEQENLARASALDARRSPDELDRVFTAMQYGEDRLLSDGLERSAQSRATILAAFVAAVALTFMCGAGALLVLRRQRDTKETEQRLARERLAREAAEAERGRLLALLNQVPAVVNYLRGPDLVLEFVHPGAAKVLGRTALLGKPLREAAPGMGQLIYYDRVRRVYETGEPFSQHQAPAGCGSDGEVRTAYWDSVYLPVRDALGSVEGVMTFDLDVTETVRTRHEMERVSRAKDEFLATVSHELRTPLNAISGWASMLRRKPREEDKVDRGLEVIQRNARAQARIVSDLLDVSRIICGKLELKLKAVQMLAAVLGAADVVKPAADGKGVRLIVDLDPRIGVAIADPDRLQQIVWNLLTNAVRFTPRGGRVTVSGDRTALGIVLRVRDTGTGIPRDKLAHIFERFMQVDSSTTRAHGGLGLGLAIVRHLVEAHGGDVEAQSEGIGRGATFTVTLPIRSPPADGADTLAAKEADMPAASSEVADTLTIAEAAEAPDSTPLHPT
ncbi:MAG TPA: PAS domain-containing sensor histidine kinase [Polyangiaceae bacterium]|nr:PAS domain-containing sensor histidine kinase [Polyangiaceae bacterium]